MKRLTNEQRRYIAKKITTKRYELEQIARQEYDAVRNAPISEKMNPGHIRAELLAQLRESAKNVDKTVDELVKLKESVWNIEEICVGTIKNAMIKLIRDTCRPLNEKALKALDQYLGKIRAAEDRMLEKLLFLDGAEALDGLKEWLEKLDQIKRPHEKVKK